MPPTILNLQDSHLVGKMQYERWAKMNKQAFFQPLMDAAMKLEWRSSPAEAKEFAKTNYPELYKRMEEV